MCSESDVLNKEILQTRIKLYETSGSQDDIEKIQAFQITRNVYWYIVTGVTVEVSVYTFTDAINWLLHDIFHC
jgi:hypothetical protein